MGGIGLSCRQPQPNTTHTYAHTIQDNKIHTYTHTPEHIYMHMHKNTTQQYPDIPVHKQTQYPDTEQHTEQKQTHLQRTLAQPQHRTTYLHTHKHTQTYLILLLKIIYQKTL